MLKYSILIGFLCILNSIGKSQSTGDNPKHFKINYLDSTVRDLYKSLSRNMKYPEEGRRRRLEGTAFFQFQLTTNGQVKSATYKNELAKTFIWMFIEAINKVPKDLLISLIRLTDKNTFILPVNFALGNNSPKYSELSDSSYVLKAMAIRVIGWQRIRHQTPHGERFELRTEGTFYELNEIPEDKSKVIGLSLFRKHLQEFPKEVQQMKSIKYLDLMDNSLVTLPDFIGDLKELEEVYLFKNKIVATPTSLSKLTKLRNLVLSNNSIGILPDVVSLENLELLDLSNNQIRKIPPDISKLTKLRFLYLDNNDIKNLPIELFELPNLKRLHLQGNPLTDEDISLIKEKQKSTEIIW